MEPCHAATCTAVVCVAIAPDQTRSDLHLRLDGWTGGRNGVLCKSVFLEGVFHTSRVSPVFRLFCRELFFRFFFFLLLSAAIFLSFNSSFPLHGMYVRQVVVDAGRDQSELTVCSVRTCRVWVTHFTWDKR